MMLKKWGWRDSNPHALRHMILSHARLPIPPHPQRSTELYHLKIHCQAKTAVLQYQSFTAQLIRL
mgnify:CR=1 FL=1